MAPGSRPPAARAAQVAVQVVLNTCCTLTGPTHAGSMVKARKKLRMQQLTPTQEQISAASFRGVFSVLQSQAES